MGGPTAPIMPPIPGGYPGAGGYPSGCIPPPYPGPGGALPPPVYPGGGYPGAVYPPGPSIVNPPMPLTVPIPAGMVLGRTIVANCRIKPRADRFKINLQFGV